MSKQNIQIQQNPFGSAAESGAMTQIEQSRSMQEVQAAMVIAKKFPRDPLRAMDNILQACTRKTLAEQGLYAYPRGKEVVTGPSIRLAEAVAQAWGNLQFGIRELEQVAGASTLESYAWDLETNTRQSKVFVVKHERYSKTYGVTQLTDPRDIYEIGANQAARRLRACILGVVPGDVIDAAVRQCEATIASEQGAPAEVLEKLCASFAAHGVTREMIEARLGHNLGSTISAEVQTLRKIFASIRDGMAKPGDFFAVAEPVDGAGRTEETEQLTASIKQRPQKKVGMKKDEDDAPPVTYAQIAESLHTATTQYAIDLAMDLARGFPPDQIDELQRIADAMEASLVQKT